MTTEEYQDVIDALTEASSLLLTVFEGEAVSFGELTASRIEIAAQISVMMGHRQRGQS